MWMITIVMVSSMMMTMSTRCLILSQVLGSHKNLHVKGDGSEGDLVIIIIIEMTIMEIIVITKIIVYDDDHEDHGYGDHQDEHDYNEDGNCGW